MTSLRDVMHDLGEPVWPRLAGQGRTWCIVIENQAINAKPHVNVEPARLAVGHGIQLASRAYGIG